MCELSKTAGNAQKLLERDPPFPGLFPVVVEPFLSICRNSRNEHMLIMLSLVLWQASASLTNARDTSTLEAPGHRGHIASPHSSPIGRRISRTAPDGESARSALGAPERKACADVRAPHCLVCLARAGWGRFPEVPCAAHCGVPVVACYRIA